MDCSIWWQFAATYRCRWSIDADAEVRKFLLESVESYIGRRSAFKILVRQNGRRSETKINRTVEVLQQCHRYWPREHCESDVRRSCSADSLPYPQTEETWQSCKVIPKST